MLTALGAAHPAVQVKPTLHGDHQYFDNVSQGVEVTKRLPACAQDTPGPFRRAASQAASVTVRVTRGQIGSWYTTRHGNPFAGRVHALFAPAS